MTDSAPCRGTATNGQVAGKTHHVTFSLRKTESVLAFLKSPEPCPPVIPTDSAQENREENFFI
jgi:hypothetical protein